MAVLSVSWSAEQAEIMRRSSTSSIPVIDLFAGPGGLGEGFATFSDRLGSTPFRIALSIEKDDFAHETLLLRSFFRQFDRGSVPTDYYNLLRGEIDRDVLFRRHDTAAKRAQDEAWHAELGKVPRNELRDRIDKATGTADSWVLIGGPPCQAYSIAGRSRNKGRKDYDPDTDERQTLYVEYLQTIADHWPSVFVMENVKGLLSATLKDQRVFQRILDDLRSPRNALRREGRSIRKNGGAHTYSVFSVVRHGMFEDTDLADYVVRAEDYGTPQARHRVIIVGIRDDLGIDKTPVLRADQTVAAEKVLDGLPRLRSGRSRGTDTADDWLDVLYSTEDKRWFRQVGDREVRARIENAIDSLTRPQKDRGAEFVEYESKTGWQSKWYVDDRLGGVCNHSTRGHMDSDLHRYLFTSCFGLEHGRSPVLSEFPPGLLPDHANVSGRLNGYLAFADRFRVQVKSRPSTTITSHIAKDGHYYIHYDPTQCRSLTVREAARLQTFPDNYLFCGPRTAQYAQVGNAVPPLLAQQIARIVAEVLNV